MESKYSMKSDGAWYIYFQVESSKYIILCSQMAYDKISDELLRYWCECHDHNCYLTH